MAAAADPGVEAGCSLVAAAVWGPPARVWGRGLDWACLEEAEEEGAALRAAEVV